MHQSRLRQVTVLSLRIKNEEMKKVDQLCDVAEQLRSEPVKESINNHSD